MRNDPTYFDRLRAYLTGQSARVYATRRLARVDLTALEEQRARAVARLTEDIEILDRYVNPLERYMDGDRLLTPLGTILDRRSGKNLPLVWTELDLREFRRWSRLLCDVNAFAVGFLGLLVDFHIRQGFGWQVRERGTRSVELGTEETITEGYESLDPRSTLIQQTLDAWKDQQQWGIKSREAFRRWRRDGEVFLRFFRGGDETDGLPVIRFVEPEQVGPPPDTDGDGEWSFGIRTDPEDVEDVLAYFVRDPLGTGSEGDEVPADRILHLKANVDSSIKRGLPDFMPVQDDLERVRRMLRNMGEVAATQSAIAWVSQYATATPDQVGTLIRAGSDYSRPKIGSPSGKYIDVVNYEPGTVLHMDANRQFVAGPIGTGTPGFIQVEQAILRGCGARWRFPEYFSGDASNNNMASSIVAGSPFVVAVEGNQLEWGVFERAVAKKVLELCVESGRLSRKDVAGVDVKVIPPSVALANREEEEKLRQMRHQAGVLSVTTWQQQVGLDPAHEAANFAAEVKRKAEMGGGGSGARGESAAPCSCEDIIVSESFTGEITDAIGRHRCYKDGKQIPCADLKRQVPTTIGQKKETPITFPLQKLFGDKKKLTAEDMFKLAQGQGANELKGDDAAALAALMFALRDLGKAMGKDFVKDGFTLDDLAAMEKLLQAAPDRENVAQRAAFMADIKYQFMRTQVLPNLTPAFTPGDTGTRSKDGNSTEYNIPDGKQLADAITQGDAGSCAFLAGLIGLLRTRGSTGGIKVRANNDGTYGVKFTGSDKEYRVDQPTQAEMLRYASAGKNGIWLSVLEKAYAKYRDLDVDAFYYTPLFSKDAYKALTDPNLKSYGRPLIRLLTGKDTERQVHYPTVLQAGKLNEEDVRGLLEKAMGAVNPNNPFRPIKVIMIAGSKPIDDVWSGDLNTLPPGHAFAVVGYDPEKKEVLLHNPQNIKGTQFGSTFKMPLDQFVEKFAGLTSEKP